MFFVTDDIKNYRMLFVWDVNDIQFCREVHWARDDSAVTIEGANLQGGILKATKQIYIHLLFFYTCPLYAYLENCTVCSSSKLQLSLARLHWLHVPRLGHGEEQINQLSGLSLDIIALHGGVRVICRAQCPDVPGDTVHCSRAGWELSLSGEENRGGAGPGHRAGQGEYSRSG